jgi:hypothetical protein
LSGRAHGTVPSAVKSGTKTFKNVYLQHNTGTRNKKLKSIRFVLNRVYAFKIKLQKKGEEKMKNKINLQKEIWEG